MTKFTEGRHAGEFILYEDEANYSRDKVTVKSGAGVIQPGHVLGKITASGKYIPSPNAQVVGSEGAETATVIAVIGGDATSADLDIAVISRHAAVKGFALIYDSSVNDDTKKGTKLTQLASRGIIAR